MNWDIDLNMRSFVSWFLKGKRAIVPSLCELEELCQSPPPCWVQVRVSTWAPHGVETVTDDRGNMNGPSNLHAHIVLPSLPSTP